MDGCAGVYFSDGVSHLDGRTGRLLPKGHRAVRPVGFTDSASRFPPGVRYREFASIGSAWQYIDSTVRGDRRRPYLVLDDKDAHLEIRHTCSMSSLSRCPRIATFVLGGTRGYAPHIADAIAPFIRDGGSTGVRKVSFAPVNITLSRSYRTYGQWVATRTFAKHAR